MLDFTYGPDLLTALVLAALGFACGWLVHRIWMQTGTRQDAPKKSVTTIKDPDNDQTYDVEEGESKGDDGKKLQAEKGKWFWGPLGDLPGRKFILDQKGGLVPFDVIKCGEVYHVGKLHSESGDDVCDAANVAKVFAEIKQQVEELAAQVATRCKAKGCKVRIMFEALKRTCTMTIVPTDPPDFWDNLTVGYELRVECTSS